MANSRELSAYQRRPNSANCATLVSTNSLPSKPLVSGLPSHSLQSQSRNIYWITSICNFLEHPWIYFLKKKSEAQEWYNQFKVDARKYYKVEVRTFKFSANFIFIDFFWTDSASELGSGDMGSTKFKAQLHAEGTFHEISAADTQSQNGVAENMNQTLCYTMVIESGLPPLWWAKSMQTAAFLIGCQPSSSNGGKWPYKKLTGHWVDPTLW